MMLAHTALIFPKEECDRSLCCDGCDERQFEKGMTVHNQDVITYMTCLGILPEIYYEIFSIYEDSIMEPTGHLLPASHKISVCQFKTLKEIESEVGCLACGGCCFIVYKIKNGISRPICANGWKGILQDGWISESDSD